MKLLLFVLTVAFGFEITALADLKPSAVLNCTVTKVTPENADFFQFNKSGDRAHHCPPSLAEEAFG